MRAACLIRATLDPKMQAMARKALVDGLVRFDEARGWRGAQQKIDLAGREWGLALSRGAGAGRRAALAAGRRAGGGRRAAPRSACSRRREAPARVSRDRETGLVTADGVEVDPPHRREGAVGRRRGLCGADGGQAGPVPPAPDARDLRRHRRHGPEYGPRSRHGRRLLLRPERVQPGDPGDAPAGLVVQAVRLRDGARQRLHAVVADPRRALRARHGAGAGGLGAVELRRQVGRPAHAALRHRALEEPDDGAPRQGGRHAADRRICPPLRRL